VTAGGYFLYESNVFKVNLLIYLRTHKAIDSHKCEYIASIFLYDQASQAVIQLIFRIPFISFLLRTHLVVSPEESHKKAAAGETRARRD